MSRAGGNRIAEATPWMKLHNYIISVLIPPGPNEITLPFFPKTLSVM